MPIYCLSLYKKKGGVGEGLSQRHPPPPENVQKLLHKHIENLVCLEMYIIFPEKLGHYLICCFLYNCLEKLKIFFCP